MKTEENKEIEQKNETEESWSFRDIVSGRVLTLPFISKQLFLFLFLCCLAVFYIDNRYVCEQQVATINKLQSDLTTAKYEALTTSSQLMRMSRQSQVEALIKQRGIDLEVSHEPPVIINKERKNNP